MCNTLWGRKGAMGWEWLEKKWVKSADILKKSLKDLSRCNANTLKVENRTVYRALYLLWSWWYKRLSGVSGVSSLGEGPLGRSLAWLRAAGKGNMWGGDSWVQMSSAVTGDLNHVSLLRVVDLGSQMCSGGPWALGVGRSLQDTI